MDATTTARGPHRSGTALGTPGRTGEQLVTELAGYVQDELAARASGMWL